MKARVFKNVWKLVRQGHVDYSFSEPQTVIKAAPILAELKAVRGVLKSGKAAAGIAYEDYCDEYYNNVYKQHITALTRLEKLIKEIDG